MEILDTPEMEIAFFLKRRSALIRQIANGRFWTMVCARCPQNGDTAPDSTGLRSTFMV